MANVIEILVNSRNTAAAGIKDAEMAVARLTGALGNVSPAAAGAMSSASGLGSALGGVAGISGVAAMGLGIAATAAIALGGAAIKAAVGLADQVEQLDRVSARTGVAVGNIQVMQQIIREAGGNAESLTTAFTFLNRAIGNNDPMLKNLGITTRDTFAAFMQLATTLSRSTDQAANTRVAMALLGRGSADLLADVKALAEQFPAMDAAMEASGLKMRGDLLESARALDAEMDLLGRNWAGIWQNIRATTVPLVNDLIFTINDLWNAINGVKTAPEKAQERIIVQLQSQIARMRAEIESGRYVGVGAERAPANLAQLERQLDAAKAKLTQLRAEAGSLTYGPPAPSADQTDIVRAAAAAASGNDKAAEAARRHAEAIRQIAEATGLATPEIERMLGVIATQEQYDAGLKFLEKYRVAARDGAQALAELVAQNTRLRVSVGGQTEPRWTPTPALPRPDLQKAPERRPVTAGQYEMKATLDQWRDFTDQVFTGAEVLNSGLTAVQQGLTTGFQTAFASMLSGAMSFAQAMRAIFTSLVNAIIAELARLAAYAVVKGLLSLVTGGVAGAATGGVGDIANKAKPLSVIGNTTNATTININALDARSILQQTVSPSGALRMTNLRMAELAAVS